MQRLLPSICAIVAVALSACAHVHSVSAPIVTDRPDQTEGTALVARGWTQLEAGVTAYGSGRAPATRSFGEALLRYGVAPRFEARFDLPSVITTTGSAHELSEGGVGFKTALLIPAEHASHAVPAVSLLASTGISTHWSRGTALGTPEVILASSWGLSDRADLSANVVTLPFAGGAGASWVGLTLSAGFDLTDRLGAYAEVYNLGSPTANGGVTWRVTPGFQVDARLGLTDLMAPRARGGPTGLAGVGFGTRW